jgi:hypothetical protein
MVILEIDDQISFIDKMLNPIIIKVFLEVYYQLIHYMKENINSLIL